MQLNPICFMMEFPHGSFDKNDSFETKQLFLAFVACEINAGISLQRD